jgi:hypothetical protein
VLYCALSSDDSVSPLVAPGPEAGSSRTPHQLDGANW